MSIFSRLKDTVTEYVDVNVKLIKINVIEKAAGITAYFIFAFICLLLVFGLLLFFGFGLSEGMIAMGYPKVAAFFTTMAFFVLLLVLVIGMRVKITRYFASQIVNIMTEDHDEDEEEDK